MKKKELQVAAIQNGTVIDHIPSDKIFQVINLLGLYDVHSPVTIGLNLKSKVMGSKGIIKIADKFFTDAQLQQLAVVCRQLTLCIIRDYEIVEKKPICLPRQLVGIVRCNNPKCITNNEPMPTRFAVMGQQLKCHYCNNEVDLSKVKLLETTLLNN